MITEAALDKKPQLDLKLDLASMYLEGAPAHGVHLQLGPEEEGNRVGTLSLDPNHCSLNDWGDSLNCTKMAWRRFEVISTRMRTLDPADHGRVLHRLHSKEFQREWVNLIEYPKADLWYLVYRRRDGASWVVPLFNAQLLECNLCGTIGTRYGVPLREAIQRGDLEEMKIEARLMRGVLEALAEEPSLNKACNEKGLTEVKEAFAELEAALAKAEG